MLVDVSKQLFPKIVSFEWVTEVENRRLIRNRTIQAEPTKRLTNSISYSMSSIAGSDRL